jgi:OPA family glycerol-3-phosphate transporter-like MFS transporter
MIDQSRATLSMTSPAAPSAKPIAGSPSSSVGTITHSREFRKRRAVNWLTLGGTYAAMYMGRYNLSFANASLSSRFGWDKTQVGTIITAALTVYGFAAFVNGPIADRVGGRRAMLIGATGSVVFNLLFGLGAYFGFLGVGSYLIAYFSLVWAMNSYFQSFSAMALIKVNAGWFHVSERGVFSAIFGSMIQSGRLLVYAIGPLLVVWLPWQWVFFIPAGIVAIMAYLTYLNVQDGPEHCGLPHLDTQDASSGDRGEATFSYVFKKVMTNPVTLTIAFAELCTGFVRHGFEQWFPRYMKEAQNLPLNSPVFAKGALSVVFAGVLGAFAAGTLSDWVFKGRRAPMAFVGYVIQILCLAVIWKAPSLEAIIAAFTINSFAISVVHSMLTGTASMDFGGKKAAGTAAGMFDGMQYLGGAFVGLGMGSLLDRFGWGVWGPSMIGFSAVGALLMLTLWNARPKRGSGGH